MNKKQHEGFYLKNPANFFRKMRLSLLLILCSSAMAFSASSYSQNTKLTLNLKNATVKEVFNKIEEQSEFLFFYQDQQINLERKVSINFNQEEVETILNSLFSGTDNVYVINDRQIVIGKAEKSNSRHQPNNSIIEQSPEKKISGKVTDRSELPLPGVSVVIKGTTVGTVTDFNGEFTLSIPAETETLIFSFVGMKTQNISAKGKTTFNIVLEEESIGIEEVVAVGYGTQIKSKMTNAVSVVHAEEMNNIPYSDISTGLAGRAAGIIVQQSGGEPGSNAKLNIRGGGTPLFVIDGVISNETEFNLLNTQDIETVNFLKDASSTAVYGARASNGVVLVTTKSGEAGELKMNYSGYYAINTPTTEPDMMSSYEWAKTQNNVAIYEGQSAIYSDKILNLYKDQTDPLNYPNTRWYDLVINDNTSHQQRHNLNLSGGSKKNRYYFSLGYQNEGGIIKNLSNDRYNFRTNLDNFYEQIDLNVHLGLSAAFNEKDAPSTSAGSIWANMFLYRPLEVAQDPETGQYTTVGSTADNPLVQADPRSGYNMTNSKVYKGVLSFDWGVPHIDGLRLKLIGAYDMYDYRTKNWKVYIPLYDVSSGNRNFIQDKPQLYEDRASSRNYNLEGHINYEKTFADDHNLKLTFVYSQSEYKYSMIGVTRRNYDFEIDQVFAGGQENMQSRGYADESARLGYVGRLNYDYKGKYLLESNFRYDGSERFPSGERMGFFPSVSLGWVASNEDFFNTIFPNVNLFKVRASYGEVGNDAIARFRYLSTYDVKEKRYVIDGEHVVGLSESELPSNSITWATQQSYNAGIDMAMFKNKLSLAFDAFLYRNKGLLASPRTDYITTLGKNLPPENSGITRRGGVETNVNYKGNIKDFHYSVGANITYFESFWEKNPSEDSVTVKNPRIRSTYESNYYYQENSFSTLLTSKGIVKSNKEIMNSVLSPSMGKPMPGDLIYEDINGDGKIDGNDYTRQGKSSAPNISFGLILRGEYRGLYMDMLWQANGSRNIYMGLNNSNAYYIKDRAQLDYWTEENTNAPRPRLYTDHDNGGNNTFTSSYWLKNGSFLRLKSLEVGYDLKYILLKNSPLSSVRAFVSGTNLLTFSDLDIFDPESSSFSYSGYPVVKTISFGLNIGF